MIGKMEKSTGVDICVRGMGFSLTKQLAVTSRSFKTPTAVSVWNGDQQFDYRLPPSAHVWLAGEAHKAISAKPFSVDISADAQLFVTVPNPHKILTHVFLEKWTVLAEAIGGVNVAVSFELFAKNYTISLPKAALVGTFALLDIGGLELRKWCAPNANPPGMFASFYLTVNPFRDVPILQNWVFNFDVIAYGFLTYEVSDDLEKLPTYSIWNDLLEVQIIVEHLEGLIAENILRFKEMLTSTAVDLFSTFKIGVSETIDVIKKAISDIKAGKFPSIPDLIKPVMTAIDNIKGKWNTFKDEIEFNIDVLKSNVTTFINNEVEKIKNNTKVLIEKITGEIMDVTENYSGYGLKASVDINIFGLHFPSLDVEFVYSVGSLGQCSRFNYMYNILKGKNALRAMGMFTAYKKFGYILEVSKGFGLEIAFSEEAIEKTIVHFTARSNFLGLKKRVDVFISLYKLGFGFEANVFNIFRARMDVESTVPGFTPFKDLLYRVAVQFLPGGDDSFEGSFGDALRRVIQNIANEAEDRLTVAQDGLAAARGDLTRAQQWLEDKKSDVDKANVVFDRGVQALQRAKDAVEEAKGPLKTALNKLSAAQKNIDNLCKITDCKPWCIPGIKCRFCTKKVLFVRIPWLCCSWTSCMIKFPNLLCLAKNAACWVIRKLAYVALEIAKIGVRALMLPFDIAKAALSVAQLVVDKARIVLDVAKGILTLAQVGLEAAKGILKGTELAIEAVKIAVKLGLKLVDLIIHHGLQSLIDIKKCGFSAEISTKDIFVIDVFCEINVLRLGWRNISVTINFRNILESLWNAAKSVIEHLTNMILFGRRKREIEYRQSHIIHKLYRSLREVDDLDGLITDGVDSDILSDVLNSTIDVTEKYEMQNETADEDETTIRIEAFKRKCEQYKKIEEFLTGAAQSLFEITNETITGINASRIDLNNDELNTSNVGSIGINVNDGLTIDDLGKLGINVTDAFVNYGITPEQLILTIKGANIEQDESVNELEKTMNQTKLENEKQLQNAETFPLMYVWRNAMENATVFYWDEDRCNGFKDCMLISFLELFDLYNNTDAPGADDMKYMTLKLSELFSDLIDSKNISNNEAMELTDAILKVLQHATEKKVFCAKAPEIKIPTELNVKLGEKFAIVCKTTGDLIKDIHWEREGELFNASSNETIDTTASLDSEGRYTCVASNHIATVRATMYISLIEPPVIVEHPESTIATVGNPDGVTFKCVVKGIPTPNITWKRILNDGENEVLNVTNAQLTVFNPKRSDEGKYLCEANNQHGSALSDHARLRVLEARVAFPGVYLRLGYIKVVKENNITKTEYNLPLLHHNETEPDLKLAIKKILRDTDEPSLLVMHSLTSDGNTDGGAITLQLRIGEYKSMTNEAYLEMQTLFENWSNLLDRILQRFEDSCENEQILTKQTDAQLQYAFDRSQFAISRKTECPRGHELYPEEKWRMICVPCLEDTSFTLEGEQKRLCVQKLKNMTSDCLTGDMCKDNDPERCLFDDCEVEEINISDNVNGGLKPEIIGLITGGILLLVGITIVCIILLCRGMRRAATKSKYENPRDTTDTQHDIAELKPMECILYKSSTMPDTSQD
ncbi:unnamed protein product [Owenia fusiformis]|uniref:Uncharacterized protein n=1 Tax=Owenia fusiformis TaxID=6347 RepID=A0A8J1THE0_OWEFU|nr:unnamed protein product [Owenia fusiformis]